jgi:drug/metabolite transporter (DMT)-like permease
MLVAYLLMCLIYGTTFFAIKLGMLSGFSPFFFAGIRFGAAGLLILCFLIAKKKPLPASRNDFRDLLSLGFCMTFLPFAALYWGEQHISSGLAALLTAFGPIVVVLFGLLYERKPLILWQWIGLALGFAGIFLVVFPQLLIGFSLSWLIGAAVILLSEIAFAWGAVFSKRLLSNGLTPLTVNSFQMLYGSLGLLALSLLFEPVRFVGTDPATAIATLLYLIVCGSVIASGIYYWLVKRTNPLFPTTWLYVSPVIALFVGNWLLEERLYPSSLVGTALVIAGVVLTNIRDWQQILGRTSVRSASAESK